MAEVEQTMTVLLVDDEENILRSLTRLLMDEEFEVETANSGEAALEKLKTLQQVALIVSDQRMPGMNGAEFLGRSQEYAPDALRILLTGYSDINATIEAINKGGAYRYISKPWNDEELLQTIRDAIRQYTLLAENKRLNAVVAAQNQELQEWNSNLKNRVLQQTTAIRIKSEDLQKSLERSHASYLGMIEALSRLVEMRGKRTHQHSQNVSQLAVNAAKELGIGGEELETIRIAALLHDIGKIGISERILGMAPDVMSPEEFREYSQHPVRAQLLLDRIEELRPAGVLIRHHHENMDGSGFPDQLANEAIPLGARIIAYANQIDKAAMQSVDDVAEQAIARTSLNVGQQLDPALQRVFKKITRYYYFSKSTHELHPSGGVELELKPEELRVGMMLARSVYSGSGLLLLQHGVALDMVMIDSIRRYYRIDPPETGIFVLVER